MSEHKDLSFLLGNGGHYVDSIYKDFLENPNSVDSTWQYFFQGMAFAGPGLKGGESLASGGVGDELKVQQLISSYREKGHFKSKINPIGKSEVESPELELSAFGLGPKHLSQSFHACKQLGCSTLQEAIARLEAIYCGPLGIEFSHIADREKREWLQNKIESSSGQIDFSLDQKKRILAKLNAATAFEKFLGTKYIGQKRFSLEGGENTIPAIDAIINKAAEQGVVEFVIGMAHRGRLNILANIMGKEWESIFSEFEGMEEARKITSHGDGDVKYHLGFKSSITTPSSHQVSLKLMPNPSHLEAVAPVVQGYARAKADATYFEGSSGHLTKALPLIIHGDAALAGQGVVYEVAQMSNLEGHGAGGAIHFVINNQIGFTTNPQDARSSTYCTGIAKVTNSPVIHVNGDDAQAVVYAAQLAVEYRQRFAQDVYIDMVCYRKYGHNESDEPKFTQPDFYELIQKHDSSWEIYTQKLISQGVISPEWAKKAEEELRASLQASLERVRGHGVELAPSEVDDEWASFREHTPADFEISPPTAVRKEKLSKIHKAITSLPPDIAPIKKSLKILEGRNKRLAENKIDWAMAELYAYGSLLTEGHDIRLSGQDCIRGTFGHRHAGVFDAKTAKKYIGLNHIKEGQGKMDVHNSLLSEYAVMGFEYGYGLARPEALTIWEAQFGDFSNTAQTIIDQFISSAKSKWNINNGIMLFLPHGYEGQGPEHSSARAERFLHLCAEFNMIVANCTTPANFFHLIRRQVKYEFRVPTIVFTPKALLRHPLCVSKVEELKDGRFEEFIDDDYCNKKEAIKVLLCTGKIYYDLAERQRQTKRKDVAIIRLEQLHPLPFKRLNKLLGQYPKAAFFWAQEEPKNMGYWNYITRKLEQYAPEVISRKSSASPATGYMALHLQEQKEIIDKAFS